MRFPAILAVLGACALVSACQSLTPQQTGQLICALASDGATVTAIYAPSAAPKAGASAQVACAAGTQVGQIVGGAQ